MKLDPYQLFSIRRCIHFGLAKFFIKVILVFKTGHVVDVFMNSLITHQSKQRCPYIAYMHVGKNIGTGMLVLLPSVNTLCFQSREIPTFSFYIDWFTRNYMDQTDSKLPESVSAHILF